jgi:hypothetical protein
MTMDSAFRTAESPIDESVTTADGSGTPLQRILAWAAGVAAVGAGLIHIEASLDHRDLVVVATGFAVMAISQWLVAAAILVRASRTALTLGGALHLGILFVWILSRTVGLPFIPGAESSAEFGVADVVANILSVVVVAAAVISIVVRSRSASYSLSTNFDRAIRGSVVAGALVLTVVAINSPHVHAGHDEPAPGTGSVVEQVTTSHDHGGGHDHEHEHENSSP